MDVKLVVVGGDAKPTEIKLKLPAIIGRGRAASLTLPHPLVSRQHCELYESGGKLFVRDMGSLNGTFVGEEKIDEAVLDSGSLLTIGNVTFRPIYGDQSAFAATEDIDFEVADNAEAGTEPAEFDFVDDDGIAIEHSMDDDAIEEIDVEQVVDDDDFEEIDDVEIAEIEDVEDIEEIEAVEEVDPLEPPSAPMQPSIRKTLPTPQKAKQNTTEKAPDPAPTPSASKKPATKDDQFMQFLDDDEDESDSSDDDDLNSFLKDFK